MKKYFYLTLVLFVANIYFSFSQALFEPVELAKKIFDKTKFKELDSYCTGEYKGRPNGQDIPGTNSLKFLLLEQTNTNAVVSMTILDPSGRGLDTYLHFIKDKIWKLEAFRALAMTGVLEKVKEQLETMTESQIDSLVANNNKKQNDPDGELFKTREDFDFQLGNTKLTLALDSEIIDHFNKNSKEFNRIRDSLIVIKKNSSDKIEFGKDLASAMKKLFIDPNGSHYSEFHDCITFLIGGILDNTVGYLYCENKNNLPKMDPASLIMLREIGNGWYIYKTT